MMFTPNSNDKSSISTYDSPTRISMGPNRFAGISPLSDESQHNIRIQLAVHRYNSGSSSTRSPSDKRNSPAGIRWPLFKNSMRKSCDSPEDAMDKPKETTNRYHGVGNFPTVRLNKSVILCRPVRKVSHKEFRVPLPELPTSRFFNRLPDDSSELKPSTRSVLDVLQDLSRKRIHSKDDGAENEKKRFRGLGGDAALDLDAPYKPLFVDKANTSPNPTRNKTTQTIESPVYSKLVVPDIVNLEEKPDSKRELRRKLAKRNNEISASLSSSIDVLKSIRKSHGPVLNLKSPDVGESSSKRTTPNSAASSAAHAPTEVAKQLESERVINKEVKLQKRVETSPKTSPNNDRLMTIFLELQDTPNKHKIFENNKTCVEKDAEKQETTVPETDAPAPSGIAPPSAAAPDLTKLEETHVAPSPPLVAADSDTVEVQKEAPQQEAVGGGAAEPLPTAATVLPATTAMFTFGTATPTKPTTAPTLSNATFNFLHSTPTLKPATVVPPTTTDKTETKTSPFGFGVNKMTNFNSTGMFPQFKFGATSSPIMSDKSPDVESATTTAPPTMTATSQVINKPVTLTFGTLNTTPAVTETAPPVPVTSTTQPVAAATTLQSPFSFGLTPGGLQASQAPAPTEAPKTFGFQLGQPSVTTASLTASEPMRQFGLPTTAATSLPTTKFSLPPPLTTSQPLATAAPVLPSIPAFGQGLAMSSLPSTTAPSTFTLTTTTTTTNLTATAPFSLGAPNPAFGQSLNPMFGQTSVTQSATSPIPSLFSSKAPEATPSLGVPTSQSSVAPLQSLFLPATSSSNTSIQAKPQLGLPKDTAAPSIFGQAMGELTKPPAFGSNPVSQPPPFGQATTQPSFSFGQPANKAAPAFGQTTATSFFGQAPSATPSVTFGQPPATQASVFGQTSEPPKPLFGGTTTTPTSPFGKASLTTNIFGTTTTSSAVTQPAPFSFGSTMSPAPAIPALKSLTSLTAFPAPPATTASSVFSFGSPSPSSPFGASATTAPAFSAGQPSSPFSAQPSTAFGSAAPPTPFSSTGSSAFSTGIGQQNTAFSSTPAPQSSTFSFGSTPASNATASTSQSPFTFGQKQSEPFKFGGSTGSTGSGSGMFAFGAKTAEPAAAAPLFSFGQQQQQPAALPSQPAQPSPFGTNPSPVFNFGSTAGSNFSFGSSPSPGMFNPGASPTPAFPMPGMFSIGSGSTQSSVSRPRASSRLRRRP